MMNEIETGDMEQRIDNALAGNPVEADVLKWLLSKLITARLEVVSWQISGRYEDLYQHRIKSLEKQVVDAKKVVEARIANRLAVMASDARRRGDEELRNKLLQAAKGLGSKDNDPDVSNLTTP